MTEVRSNTFTTHDGVSLFYRHWPAADVQPGAAVSYTHLTLPTNREV